METSKLNVTTSQLADLGGVDGLSTLNFIWYHSMDRMSLTPVRGMAAAANEFNTRVSKFAARMDPPCAWSYIAKPT